MAQYKAAIKCGAPVSCLSCFLLSTKINIPMYTHNNNAGRHFYDNKVHIEPKGAGFSVAFFHSPGSFVNTYKLALCCSQQSLKMCALNVCIISFNEALNNKGKLAFHIPTPIS